MRYLLTAHPKGVIFAKIKSMLLDLDRKSLNYGVFGKGQPILLTHGWGGNSKSLKSLARLLSSKYQAITLDLPGFGESDDPDPDWGIEEYANVIIDFICGLKLRPVVFFGHSFGGALGISLAAKHPDHIKKLVVSGASYKRDVPATAKISQLLNWLPVKLKIAIYKIFFPKSDLYKVPQLESNFREIVKQDLTPLLQLIKAPTLILWGAEDKETSISHAYELHKKIKESKLKIFPEIGHNLPLQYSQKVYEEIDKFMQIN